MLKFCDELLSNLFHFYFTLSFVALHQALDRNSRGNHIVEASNPHPPFYFRLGDQSVRPFGGLHEEGILPVLGERRDVEQVVG